MKIIEISNHYPFIFELHLLLARTMNIQKYNLEKYLYTYLMFENIKTN